MVGTVFYSTEFHARDIDELPFCAVNESVAWFGGVGLNHAQENLYARNVSRRGPDARLYGAMIGGVTFLIGTSCEWREDNGLVVSGSVGRFLIGCVEILGGAERVLF
jgi:hypothetical protein